MINCLHIQADPNLPCCLKCGEVQYEPPQLCHYTRNMPPRPTGSNCQRIRDCRGIYRHRRGTCLDLACERAARLRLAGHLEAVVVIEVNEQAKGDFHAYVETANGPQDPAAELQNFRVGCLCDGEESDE